MRSIRSSWRRSSSPRRPSASTGAAASPAAGFASSVPVTSTLCPTCAVNWLSSASSRYVFGVAVASDAGEAFVRMNFEASAAAAPPVVPTGMRIPADTSGDDDLVR